MCGASTITNRHTVKSFILVDGNEIHAGKRSQ
jgi:hypothetical protein